MGGGRTYRSVCMSKTDQSGAKGDLARHACANPLDAVLCPVTALGLYLLSVSPDGALLFTASRHQKSLGEHTTTFFRSEEGQHLCEEQGVDPTQFGTHSLHKGSTSWCTCGTTASPSELAALMRDGWATGAAWERYTYLIGRGQDCYIGRIMACLPVLQPEFALLPPHFKPGRPLVTQVVNSYFGPLLERHPHLTPIDTHCLASVVHHADRLAMLLPPTHHLAHDEH